jgi:molybdopterin-guanine dinucleotide biosynthesis protein A
MATAHMPGYDAGGNCMSIQRADITGLILAGGRGSRMGGVDKGLQLHHGVPLALHALQRLRPQVAAVAINANRNLPTYGAFGVPVWPDARPDFAGPLAGMLAGLSNCRTNFVATAPCDTPNFPPDLVARLAEALTNHGAEIAVAATRQDDVTRPEPVFCLMQASLRDSLAAFLDSGERKTGLWSRQHRYVQVVFEDTAAFFNANTADELELLQPQGRP